MSAEAAACRAGCVSRPSQARKEARNPCGKKAWLRGDKPADNGDNGCKLRRHNLENYVLGKSSVIEPRRSALLIAAIAGCVVLQPLRAHAQWWSRAPADFDRERRNSIAAALTAKQVQVQVQQAAGLLQE